MNEQQFLIMYGKDKKKWTKSVAAIYDALFKGLSNSAAADKHGITRQTVGQQLAFNKVKHDNMEHTLNQALEYFAAGDENGE